MEESLKPFHAFLDEQAKTDVRPIPLPYSKPEDAKYTKIDDHSRPIVEQKVAEKICKAYRRLYVSLQDKNMGGYDDAFLSRVVEDYPPEQLCDLLQVTLPPKEDPKQQPEFVNDDNDILISDVDEDDDGERSE